MSFYVRNPPSTAARWLFCQEQWDESLNGPEEGLQYEGGYCYFDQVTVARPQLSSDTDQVWRESEDDASRSAAVRTSGWVGSVND